MTRRGIFSSKQYVAREKSQLAALKEQEVLPMKLDEPLEIQYSFRWPDKRKTDISNKIESINDMLVKYWFLLDDNSTIIKIIKARAEWVDKDNPRCELYIHVLDL